MKITEITNEYGLTDEQYKGLAETAKKICELNGVDEVRFEKHGENIYIYAVTKEEIACFEDDDND